MPYKMVEEYVDDQLNSDNILDSLEEEIYRIPFTNNQDNGVYVSSAKKDGNSVTIDMSDGTTFVISVRRL